MTRQPGLRGLSLPMPTESEPLTLRLPDGRGQLTCLEAVREVRGKRCVYRCRWHDTDVYAKVFIGRLHARRRWQREKRGIEALAAHGLATPPLLYAGLLAEPRAYVLVTEALVSATTMEQACNRCADQRDGMALLERAVTLLAEQHQAGIQQADLHLENLLVAGDRIYSIDASRLRLRGQPLSRRVSLRNFGLFLGQFFPRFDLYIGQLLAHYAHERKWEVTARDLALVRRYSGRVREKRKRNFLRKIMREGSRYALLSNEGYRIIYNKQYFSEGLQQLLLQPQPTFAQADTRYLKKGNTSTVVLADIDGMKVVVKRYNIKGTWHGIRKAVQKTRAAISWRNAHLLQFYGIDTPTPIAIIEGRFASRQRVSYFLSEYVAGTNCRDYFANGALSADNKRRVAKQAADLLAMLAQLRIRHGDMKATNMIIAQGRIYLIDLDGMQAYKTLIFFRRGLARDRERFRRNWEADTGTWRLFEESMEHS